MGDMLLPGIGLALLGAGLMYAAAPNAALLHTPLFRRPLGMLGGGALFAALLLFRSELGPAAAAFTLVTHVMLFWTLAPAVVAAWRGDRGRR